MKHFTEEDLIAYQLHESSNEAAISSHLEDAQTAQIYQNPSLRHSESSPQNQSRSPT